MREPCIFRPMKLVVKHPIRMNVDGGISSQQRVTAPSSGSSEHNANVMLALHNERDVCIGKQRSAVQLRHRHTATDMAWIVHRNVIDCGMIPELHGVPRPMTRNTRIDGKRRATQAETEHPLRPGPIEPTRRTAVPGPSSSSDMGRLGIDVADNGVGLDFVALDICSRGNPWAWASRSF